MQNEQNTAYLLGQIMGRLDEIRKQSTEANDAMRRLEEKVDRKLTEHDGRLRTIEVESAREAGRRGMIGGAGAASVITALVEAGRHLFK